MSTSDSLETCVSTSVLCSARSISRLMFCLCFPLAPHLCKAPDRPRSSPTPCHFISCQDELLVHSTFKWLLIDVVQSLLGLPISAVLRSNDLSQQAFRQATPKPVCFRRKAASGPARAHWGGSEEASSLFPPPVRTRIQDVPWIELPGRQSPSYTLLQPVIQAMLVSLV